MTPPRLVAHPLLGDVLRAFGLAGGVAVILLPPLLVPWSVLRGVVVAWLLVGGWLMAFVILRTVRQRREREGA